MYKLLTAIVFFSALLLQPNPVFADDGSPETTTPVENSIPTLPAVTVTAESIDKLSSSVTRNSELIKSLPSGNGNVNDLLRTVPGVQFPEDYNDSTQAGEIKPPEISISGGRPSENKYILDGVGFNSYFDPNVTNRSYAQDLPGHSQEFFLPDHMVEDISIYRSNIPARYGGFLGGLEIIDTKDPAAEISGDLGYRTTRNEWTEFHIDPSIEEDFNNSTSERYQPDYSKEEVKGSFNLPINDHSGLVFFASRFKSTIPISLFAEKESQYRRNDLIFLKYVQEPSLESKLTMEALYNQYQEDAFLEHTSYSDYKFKHGGYKIAGKLEQGSRLGETEINLSWQQSSNDREAPQSYYNWTTTDIKNAGEIIDRSRSPEGGYGDLEKTQKSLTANIHQEFVAFSTTGVEHNFNAGAEIRRTELTSDRQDTTTHYSVSRVNEDVVCTAGAEDCITGDQFFWFKRIYPEGPAEASVNNLSTYIDNEMNISRLTFRPGLRISYSDYQKNTDFAPRLAASYDLFGDDSTVFLGGYNRYYSDDLLADKLRAQRLPYEVWRRSLLLDGDDHPQDWAPVPRTSVLTSRVADLKTPYSDEFTVGIRQQLFGGILELLYIDRDFKDQIVTLSIDDEDGIYTYQEFSNDGRRHHEEVSLSWEGRLENHYLFVDVTWQETKSNSSHYDDLFDPNEPNEYVWYDNQLTRRDKLLISNHNRPVLGKLIYKTELPHGFTFANETVYRSSYDSVAATGDTVVDPDSNAELDIYEDTRYKSSVVFDWKLTWETPDINNHRLEFELEILNVFNKKVAIGEKVDQYRLGRQYWAGLTYKF